MLLEYYGVLHLGFLLNMPSRNRHFHFGFALI